MTADQFRRLFDYHFALNRRVWDQSICALTDEQFTREIPYSMGSMRNQTVHMMSVDQRWFCGLRGAPVPDFLDPITFPDRAAVRAHWDRVEAEMREVLDQLTDEKLNTPFIETMMVWEVLFHVLNHGTDHRAQILAMLHQLGALTFPQDYAHYAFARP